VNKRDVISGREFADKIGYNDYTNDAIAHLKSIDKSFYRVNKDYFSGVAIHKGLNDAKVQGFYGTSSYSSFNQLYYINFLQETDVIKKGDETQTRWSPGLMNRPLLQTLTSVKYNLSTKEQPEFPRFGYHMAGVFGDVKLMKNDYTLPLGFTYDHFLEKSDFSKLSQLQKDIFLLKGFVVDRNAQNFKELTANAKPLSISDSVPNFNFQIYRQLVDSLRKDTLTIAQHTQNQIKGIIKLENDKMLFLSIPFDMGWHALVDGKTQKLELINMGFMGLPLTKGTHNVELFYKPPYIVEGGIVSAISISILLCLVGFMFYQKKKAKHEATNQAS